ncbi:MAG: DUF4214 domain-containing protein [Devosia sp.]|uniref:DUF4214 domain-containing protein n=1 Tax=Devosia sp. TaxID=1871048 RepID=UPI0019F89297|nr:DUF4214 domain-containing protein [Devosia sp.]MBF0679906.1 DUF4214 domain-containing protein [Devosia sp.]
MSAAIQGIYVALFGRPADPAGLAYWVEVTKNGADLAEMLRVLPSLTEYTDRYADQTPEQVITAVYQNLFGRDPDPAGLAFFKGQLDAGILNMASLAVGISQGARDDDKADFQAKVEAATMFTASLDTPEEIAAYSGDAANALAKKFLDTVNKDAPATPESAETAAGAVVAGEDPTEGGVQNPGGGGGDNPDPVDPNADLIAAFNAADDGADVLSLIGDYEETLAVDFDLVGGRADAVGNGVNEVRDLFGEFSTLAEIQTALSRHIIVEQGKRDALAKLYSTDDFNEFRTLVERLNDDRVEIISYYEQLGGSTSSPDAVERIDDLKDELYTLALSGLVADAENFGWKNLFEAFEGVRGGHSGSVVTLVDKLYEAHAEVSDEIGAVRAMNLADDYGDILAAIKDPKHWEEFQAALEGDAFPDGQGREEAVGKGVLEHISLFGPFVDKADAGDVISLHITTELNKANLLSAARATGDANFAEGLESAIRLVHNDRQEIITLFSAGAMPDPDGVRKANELRADDYTVVLNEIITFANSLGDEDQGYWDAFGTAFIEEAGENPFGGSVVKLVGVLEAAHDVAAIGPVIVE